jgi:hypothetical protein
MLSRIIAFRRVFLRPGTQPTSKPLSGENRRTCSFFADQIICLAGNRATRQISPLLTNGKVEELVESGAAPSKFNYALEKNEGRVILDVCLENNRPVVFVPAGEAETDAFPNPLEGQEC